MSAPHTIAMALAWATDQLRTTSPTARLDSELLLAATLAWPRVRILAEGRATQLNPEQQQQYRALVARRLQGEPIAYLTHRREFYGIELYVDERVLVPRPETELLVDLARAHAATQPHLQIADICTGSGCIALALATQLLQASIVATDLSAAALAVAQINLARYDLLGRVALLQGDLLSALPGPVDLLISNPPYTLLAEIDPGVRDFEPHLALDGGPDGLHLYRRLLAQAPAALRPGGMILLEIGATQALAITQLAQAAFPNANVHIHRDLAGLDRVVQIDCTVSPP